ncbi:hypothetical protein L4C38_01825 [Vibrio kasasachensis]|uniref:hypothetical protein n=1 Tax=Vibrio kasasachensis TaxID=2910248 RepID=UPI003D0EACE2
MKNRVGKRLGLLAIIMASGFHHVAAAQQCDVRISGKVPEHVSLENVEVATYNTTFPITSREFSICASKQDLAVFARVSPNNKVYLIDRSGEMPDYLYHALAFIQTKELHLDAASSLINGICQNRCGYYASRHIQASPELQSFAQQYQSTFPKGKESRRAFFKENNPKLEALYGAGIELASITEIENSSIGVDPYSGSSRYFFSERFVKIGVFKETFRSSMGTKIDKDAELLPLVEGYAEQLKSLMDGNDTWPQREKKIDEMIARLSKQNGVAAPAIIDTLKESTQQADRAAEVFLSNDEAIPFSNLTQAKSTFELVLANWTISAYTNAEDKQKFAALFSERFKKQELPLDRETDKALSRVMALPSVLGGTISPAKGYQAIQVEFNNALPDSTTRYEFRDALHTLVFIYEKGAWRLDEIRQLPLSHYEA